MARARRNPWIAIGFDAWRLGLESSAVIGLRTHRMALGAMTAAEADRMVREKLEAGVAIGGMAITGRLGASPAGASARTLAYYRRKVAANRRRLAKG
ncbi:MAG: hypothetical protein ACXWKN_14840 [Phenylobacterium sp.]